MRKTGLDFGTTTSILSYNDGGRISSFKQGGAGGTPYIPSVLSVEKEDDALEIGDAARLNMGDSDYDVYTNFKMLLAEKDENILAERGYRDKTPREAARDFISSLIEMYGREMNLSDSPEKLVVTVPEIWVREGRHKARETLKGICLELGLPYKLLSEPVAASAYFARKFRERHEKGFRGHVLVCDYGGGTLDLSLSRVEGEKISVLEGTGKGVAADSLGVAGVAFDEAMVKRMLDGEDCLPKRFFRLRREFEEKKIGHGQTGKLEKALKRYRKNPATSKKVFELSDTPVTPKDLIEVFDGLIAPELDKALTEMEGYLKKNNVDTEDPERFRVVMVGGFSGFYLVKDKVRSFFGSKTGSDRRFDTCFDLADTALAISKGAALVANDFYQIDVSCPISVGISGLNASLEKIDMVCLEKGRSVSEYHRPKFLENIGFSVMSEKALDTSSVTLFLDVGGGKRRYLNLKGKLRDVLPNPRKDNEWKIGFSVDDDLIFTLHVRDKQGESKFTQLGNLEEKIGGLHIVED